MKIIAENRKARYDYHIEEVVEAGIALTGPEVKALRQGKASIIDSYADCIDNEIMLLNASISEYDKAKNISHLLRRPRKLLLHKSQIRKFIGYLRIKGKTLVPLKLYFNKKNIAKVELAVATGKKQHDKREAIKSREWQIKKMRAMRDDS